MEDSCGRLINQAKEATIDRSGWVANGSRDPLLAQFSSVRPFLAWGTKPRGPFWETKEVSDGQQQGSTTVQRPTDVPHDSQWLGALCRFLQCRHFYDCLLTYLCFNSIDRRVRAGRSRRIAGAPAWKSEDGKKCRRLPSLGCCGRISTLSTCMPTTTASMTTSQRCRCGQCLRSCRK